MKLVVDMKQSTSQQARRLARAHWFEPWVRRLYRERILSVCVTWDTCIFDLGHTEQASRQLLASIADYGDDFVKSAVSDITRSSWILQKINFGNYVMPNVGRLVDQVTALGSNVELDELDDSICQFVGHVRRLLDRTVINSLRGQIIETLDEIFEKRLISDDQSPLNIEKVDWVLEVLEHL